MCLALCSDSHFTFQTHRDNGVRYGKKVLSVQLVDCNSVLIGYINTLKIIVISVSLPNKIVFSAPEVNSGLDVPLDPFSIPHFE